MNSPFNPEKEGRKATTTEGGTRRRGDRDLYLLQAKSTLFKKSLSKQNKRLMLRRATHGRLIRRISRLAKSEEGKEKGVI